jgi:hypothetical protein
MKNNLFALLVAFGLLLAVPAGAQTPAVAVKPGPKIRKITFPAKKDNPADPEEKPKLHRKYKRVDMSNAKSTRPRMVKIPHPRRTKTPASKATFHCKGDELLDLSGKVVQATSGVAILAEGNCKLILKGSVAQGPVALEMHDKATAEITKTMLQGTITGIRMFDDTRIIVKSANITGPAGLDALDRVRVELEDVTINGIRSSLYVPDKGVVVLKRSKLTGNKTKGIDAKIVVREK